MKDYNWEYVDDSSDNIDDYDNFMNDGTYLDDDHEQKIPEWENYYEEVSEILE